MARWILILVLLTLICNRYLIQVINSSALTTRQKNLSKTLICILPLIYGLIFLGLLKNAPSQPKWV